MPRKLVAAFGLALALSLLTAMPVGAQGTITGNLQGMIKDSDGQALPGATVTALRVAQLPGGDWVAQTVVDV